MVRARGLLWSGIAGAVSFVVVFLVDGAVKPDYDAVGDLVSEAAIGRGGWVQIANFILTGFLLAFSAVALRQTVAGSTALTVGIVGVSLICAGVFVSDPVPHERASTIGRLYRPFRRQKKRIHPCADIGSLNRKVRSFPPRPLALRSVSHAHHLLAVSAGDRSHFHRHVREPSCRAGHHAP